MLVLFMCQLALIIYVWVQRDTFLKSMDNVIATIWNQRHTDQKVLDTLQLTVSLIVFNLNNRKRKSKIPKSRINQFFRL